VSAGWASALAFVVALWCVFAPAWAFRRGYGLGQRVKSAELLPLLRKSSELMQAHQKLMRSLLDLRTPPAQHVENLLAQHRSPPDAN